METTSNGSLQNWKISKHCSYPEHLNNIEYHAIEE
jgi:hypothetical protein